MPNPIAKVFNAVTHAGEKAAGTVANAATPNGMNVSREGVDPYTTMPSSDQDTAYWTLNTGAPVYDNDHSLSLGARGPLLLEDYQLLEKLAAFDRERIPERVVHARGAVAKGFFEVTHDISHLSCADVFKGVGNKTPVLARFSTVIHERGSPETLRDVRGFSVKFYTREGNWDLVGNDIPVFFIRDGMKFPDLVHALKPNPRTNIQEPWRILDFLSHFPESTHILTWIQDDHGIPRDYRHMPGFGVHTFKLVNKEGRETYVKFHWKTRQGEEFLLKEEASKVAALDHAHATKDLFDSIETGDYPKWDLYIQTMEIADENKFDFDPLDNTKVWPESQFPLQPVGTMTLDTNVDNFFAENEQVAFAPSNLVPGIAPSDDHLLQTRLFSYSDTQRYRLGANYLQLPVNAPKVAHHNNHHDGKMNFMTRKEEVNYWPSRHLGQGRHPAVMSSEHAEPKQHDLGAGKPVRTDLQKHDDFKQGGDRYRSLVPERQERMVERFSEWLAHPRVQEDVRQTWFEYLTRMDSGLGSKTRKLTADMIASKSAEERAAKPAGPPQS